METGQGIAETRGMSARLYQFSAELGRRRVWRTALAYAAVVFILLQVGEIVFPAFGAPVWALRVLVVSCFLGFPVVLCLAWLFDITPGGIRKTLGVIHSGRGVFRSGRALPRIALLAVTFATMGGLGWWTVQDALRAEALPVPSNHSPALLAGGTPDEAMPVRSLAVLPLDDFSEEEGGEYFTAGLHEEIVSELSQAVDARVLSRTSVVQYDRSGKAMPSIASELGVDAVLEGSVFRSGDRVRITVQLIHGQSDTHLWANSYEGTLEDAIALQRTVAEAIATEIDAEISGEAEAALQTQVVAGSTEVPQAYRRGRAEASKGTREGLASAIVHYEKVLDEDSSFTPARAGLATARSRLGYHIGAPEGKSPDQRIAGARRLAAASHYQEAEGALRELVLEVGGGASAEAWKVMEQIKAVQGDFEGVVQLRLERLRANPGEPGMDSISLIDLRTLLEEEGEKGYWSWKVEELEALSRMGEAVSPLELARASVGVGDLDRAFPYLHQALEEGDKSLFTLWTDPAWEALRPDPRFSELLTQVRRSVSKGGLPFPDLP